MSELSTTPQRRVLEAAKAVFARFGYRKTSMEDIAREAGVSRPSLYGWYGNKRALLQALAEAMTADVLQASDAAWPDGTPLAEGLPAAILAKDLPLYRLVHASPHGAELLTVDEALTATIATALEARFAVLLTEKARLVPGLDLAVFEHAAGFGVAMTRLAGGLKEIARSEDDYVTSVRLLCRIVTAACR